MVMWGDMEAQRMPVTVKLQLTERDFVSVQWRYMVRKNVVSAFFYFAVGHDWIAVAIGLAVGGIALYLGPIVKEDYVQFVAGSCPRIELRHTERRS